MTVNDPVELVALSTPAKGVRLVTLNRPQKRNALSQQLIQQFLHALSDAAIDTEIYAVVITGSGSFFCAGADLKEIAELDDQGARSVRYLEDLCMGIAAFKKPIIAAVNGPALGGGFEVALMSDIIVASKSAYFCLPETKIGLIPGAGGTQRLTAAVGKFRAMRSILLAEPISAEDAATYGLVSEVVTDNVLECALRTAAVFTARNKEAVVTAKQAVCRADKLCRDDTFERNLYYACFGTEEKRERVSEFLHRR